MGGPISSRILPSGRRTVSWHVLPIYTDGGTRSGSPNTAPLYTGFQFNRGYLKKGLRLDENSKVIYHTNILIVKMFTNFEQNSPAKLFNYFSAWFINYTHSLISFALYR